MPRSRLSSLAALLLCSVITLPACSAEQSASVESNQRDTMYFNDGDRQFQLSSNRDRNGVSVEIASSGSTSGLAAGDVITGIGTATIIDLPALQAALKALHGGEASLEVRNGSGSRSVLVLADEYATWIPPDAPPPPAPPSASLPTDVVDSQPDVLTATISALDKEVFSAFNHCQDPAQLKRHASYFVDDVEFYHDTGGVTWNRDAMIANTRKNACGNYRRELVAGSLRVFPVKDFGAIEQGVHRFCQVDSGNCDGLADFVIVWRQDDNSWRITRVLSYGHRSERDSAG